MAQIGYKNNFLGDDFLVDLPTITPQLAGSIVRDSSLRDDIILDYPNFSVVMNSEYRQAIYSAANVNFNNIRGKGRDFRIDTRIDANLQLDNIYYKDIGRMKNPYDRGHLTRRAAVAWGDTQKDANDASKDSCFFTNISLQHRNFNQDEWHAIEKSIQSNNSDSNNKFNIFTGTIFTPLDRFIEPTRNLKPARIPSGFWKVITYIGKTSQKLEVNAFIAYQDDEAISAMNQVLNNNQVKAFDLYQVSTTLVEELTGLKFPNILFDNNPMFFFDSEETERLNITTPQINHITPLEINSHITFRQ